MPVGELDGSKLLVIVGVPLRLLPLGADDGSTEGILERLDGADDNVSDGEALPVGELGLELVVVVGVELGKSLNELGEELF